MRATLAAVLFAALAACRARGAEAPVAAPAPAAAPPISIAVMDPLAAQLSCACVKGYSQRDYDLLAAFLEKRLRRPVLVFHAEELGKALRLAPAERIHCIIGKDSVVKADAAELRIKASPIAVLTGKDGSTKLAGLFVVPKDDPAKSLADLTGYRIIFGPPEDAEKRAVALAALRAATVSVPEPIEAEPSCSSAAQALLKHQGKPPAAAVISSYALALLEGCATVKKGSLRVVGETAPVRFVTVFATECMDEAARREVVTALLAVRKEPALLEKLESQRGFIRIVPKGTREPKISEEPAPPASPATVAESRATLDAPPAGEWRCWRGPGRDGIAPWLPRTLAPNPRILWKKGLTGQGHSGLVATADVVVVADRSPDDTDDIFRCLAAATGDELWAVAYPAPGTLEYGNAPRASPIIDGDLVHLLGAFGDLRCVRLKDGAPVWKKNLNQEFGGKLPRWGVSASPLLLGNRLIVNPGARKASLAALDARTGAVLWRSPGNPAAYSSFIAGTFGGRLQIVGYDAISLGGWDPETGKRLWTLIPPETGDYNVATPVRLDGTLLLATENNGTRLHRFDGEGTIIAEPLARNEDLAPDTMTPVAIGGLVFGSSRRLVCLDARDGLAARWTAEDPSFDDHLSIIGSGDRILVWTVSGELLLASTNPDRFELLGRARIFAGESAAIAHPAIAGKRLFLRGSSQICCVDLGAE